MQRFIISHEKTQWLLFPQSFQDPVLVLSAMDIAILHKIKTELVQKNLCWYFMAFYRKYCMEKVKDK